MLHSIEENYFDGKVTKSKKAWMFKEISIFFLNKIFLEIVRQFIKITRPIGKT